VSLLDAIISGLLQGFSEFLPISSSGHLVLLHYFSGINQSNMTFDIILHIGTLMAVIAYFRKDILNLFTSDRKSLIALFIAMLPAALVGVFFYSYIETFFLQPKKTALLLILNGIILMSASYIHIHLKAKKSAVSIKDGFYIGLGQVLGLFPGISRSGATISVGLFERIEYRKVIVFSFLLSILAISGAFFYEIISGSLSLAFLDLKIASAGLLAAFISGIISIRFLIATIRRKKLWAFGIYSIILGAVLCIIL
jgi:undecaprenyl-diphosphatase